MNVSQEIIEALRTFANEHGRSWRSKLRRLWDASGDEGLLRQARNVIGPSGLDSIQFNMNGDLKGDQQRIVYVLLQAPNQLTTYGDRDIEDLITQGIIESFVPKHQQEGIFYRLTDDGNMRAQDVGKYGSLDGDLYNLSCSTRS